MPAKKDNKKGALLVGGAILAFLLFRSSGKDESETESGLVAAGGLAGKYRGLSNNNPLNIIKTSIDWQGEDPNGTDPDFETFQSMAYGYRATLKNLQHYFNTGTTSLEDVVNQWANGGSDYNNNYVAFVSNKTGVSPSSNLSNYVGQSPENLWKFIRAMAIFENGADSVSRVDATKPDFLSGLQMVS